MTREEFANMLGEVDGRFWSAALQNFAFKMVNMDCVTATDMLFRVTDIVLSPIASVKTAPCCLMLHVFAVMLIWNFDKAFRVPYMYELQALVTRRRVPLSVTPQAQINLLHQVDFD